MLQLLVDFFYSLFDAELPDGNLISDLFYDFQTNTIFYGGGSIPLDIYLTIIVSYISLFVILVLCCLFIWKIIKLVGGLIR